jgi:hypothetical protein
MKPVDQYKKDELYELAKKAQLPGRSTMNKQQLYDALSKQKNSSPKKVKTTPSPPKKQQGYKGFTTPSSSKIPLESIPLGTRIDQDPDQFEDKVFYKNMSLYEATMVIQKTIRKHLKRNIQVTHVYYNPATDMFTVIVDTSDDDSTFYLYNVYIWSADNCKLRKIKSYDDLSAVIDEAEFDMKSLILAYEAL